MKTGRNDPCPCGSGKKYKKCCLAKDEAARPVYEPAPEFDLIPPEREALKQQPIAPLPAKAPRQEPPPDPKLKAIESRYEEFMGLDYAGQIALYLKTLDEPELMDGEQAHVMLGELFTKAVRSGEPLRFCEWVAAMRSRLPETYASEEAYLLAFEVESLLLGGRYEDARTPVGRLGELAGDDLGLFDLSLDQIEYHGLLDALADAHRLGWARLRDHPDYEFAERGALYEIALFLRDHPAATGDEPELIERVRYFFGKVNAEGVKLAAMQLSGRVDLPRSLDAYAIQSEPEFEVDENDDEDDWDADEDEFEDDDELEDESEVESKSRPGEMPEQKPRELEGPDFTIEGQPALTALVDGFIGQLIKDGRVPFTRARMARYHLVRYLVDRNGGELIPGQGPTMALDLPRHRRPSPPKIQHPLCPDAGTLDAYLARLMAGLFAQRYQATALFEVVPAWMGYLATLGLLDAARQQSTTTSMASLVARMNELLKTSDDPVLAQAGKGWE